MLLLSINVFIQHFMLLLSINVFIQHFMLLLSINVFIFQCKENTFCIMSRGNKLVQRNIFDNEIVS